MDNLFSSSNIFDTVEIEGLPAMHSVQTFKPNYSELWGSYLGGDLDDDSQYDVREPGEGTLVLEDSEKKEERPRPSLNIKRPRLEVFERLSKKNNSKQLDSSSLSILYPFTPKLNKNSLRIAHHLKSQTRHKTSSSSSILQSPSKPLTLAKSKKLCLQKFSKEFSHVLTVLAQKVTPFDQTKYTLEQMFYILAGLGFISYNAKMDGFVEKEERLVRRLWGMLAVDGWVDRQRLEGVLGCIQGLVEEKDLNFQKEEFVLLYYNRLNHQKKAKARPNSQTPKQTLSSRSRQLAESYRRKSGVNKTGSSVIDGLKFQEVKKKQFEKKISKQRARKQSQQILKCTFKPKTLKNIDAYSLYDKPIKKKKTITAYDKQPNKQNIQPPPPAPPIPPKPLHPLRPTQTPKSYAKQILRMRQCLKQKQPTAPFSRGPIILNVDVDITDKLTQKIQIHQNDNPQHVLDKFCNKHSIQQFKRVMLKEIVAGELRKIGQSKMLR